ncbi:hypothetical protein K491DRAFT_577123, partial [Lophiostoma macrostomum CBS 122681]
ARTAPADPAQREAFEHWGYLIKDDKCGTDKFDRLLKGVADIISTQFEPHGSSDLTPSQLAAFYRSVGGNYDVLFIETPPTSISFIYRSLGAFHSLQPAPDDDGYGAPTIPALQRRGFVTWQTIQLLLGPEEHVAFLQEAVKKFDVKDPQTGEVFPKLLPKECFPDRPDDAMEAWYESVAQRLKREAEEDATEKQETHVRVEVDDHGPRTSSEMSGDDERHGAATYFSDPLYRKARTRPPFMRHVPKQPSYVEDRSRSVANRVRHMLNPFSRERRRSPRGKYDDSYSDEDELRTPVAAVPPPHRQPVPPSHTYSNVSSTHKRPHPPRRGSSLSTTDSDSDSDGPPNRHRPPVLRHRRSHDPPVPVSPPRDYFPTYYEGREREPRYSHETTPSDRPMRKEDGPPSQYGPTKSPLFATTYAQMQQGGYYDRRPSMPPKASYQPTGTRYNLRPADADVYPWDRGRNSYEGLSPRDRDRDRDRDRRRSEEFLRDRDRDGGRQDSVRTRSHDRVKEEWDERSRSR